jgi:5'-3' exonuclease
MNKEDFRNLSDKIREGCKRAFEKLLAEEKLRDGELVFADDEGKPVIVRAREFEAYQQKRAAEKEKKKS